ncbi:MAG: response regulator [Nanoarchaeota archaeon]|nr:response regulator [Nanoarchaeota archaeon]MBU4116492.1 response regulator [Nanoarchaeota archaeon]
MEQKNKKELEKILIADDEIIYRNILAQALFENYEIEFASNADEEIEKSKQNKYLLILTDNQMNDGYGNSGLYAIEQIRKHDKNTPIYLHSGGLTNKIKTKALSLGANDVFKKIDSFMKLDKILTELKGGEK